MNRTAIDKEDIMVSYLSRYRGTGRIRTFFCYIDERVIYKGGEFFTSCCIIKQAASSIVYETWGA